MAYTPKTFQEWHFNEILYALFAIKDKNKYMLVFQEHDLENYFDVDRYRTSKDTDKRRKARAAIENVTKIENFCQTFKSDAILISNDGIPFVLEVKMHQAATVNACNGLVLQALIYSNILLSPAYYHDDKKIPIPPYNMTRNFLDLLITAHWFSRVYDERVISKRKIQTIEEKGKFMFEKKNFRIRTDAGGILFAIPNPRRELLPLLMDACQRVKLKSFEGYCEEVTFNKKFRFAKRLVELKHNWQKLQSTSFHFLPINIFALQHTLGESMDLSK